MQAPPYSHLSDHVTLASPIPVWLTMLTIVRSISQGADP